MKMLKLAAILTAGLVSSAVASAVTLCPVVTGSGITSADNCNVLITISSTGAVSVTGEDTTHPYDGSDDQLVGIVNNWSNAVSSVTLDGGTGNDIFGFDGDGIDTFVTGSNGSDLTGYGGPDSFFSGINPALTMGTVDFVTALAANGGSTYFSLEGAPNAGTFTGTVGGATPEPSSIILLGTGIIGIAAGVRRRYVK